MDVLPLLKQRAQHPGGLLVCFQAAGEHVGGAFVAGGVGHLDRLARGVGGDLVALSRPIHRLLWSGSAMPPIIR